MEIRENVIKKNPNQEDFPMLEFFYYFSIEHNLAQIKGEYLSATKKGHQFLRLSDEEKYSLFIQYILSDDFFYFDKADLDIKTAMSTRDNIVKLLSQLKEGIFYKYDKFNIVTVGPFKYVLIYLKYLKLIGIIEYSYYPTFSFSITPSGKIIFNILSNKNESSKNHGKVIYLNNIK